MGNSENPADDKLQSEFGGKIDLNNAHVRQFRECRGMYPTLARLVITNAPYERVEDVLDIPHLSDRQKQTLSSHFGHFTVTPPRTDWTEGDDRFNPGLY
ncbi:photosystem II complex extrinsic protein PsbU [Roseofilum sp. BLCC_M154]|uniref:Photosystem II complex extrinsic protein PsbU n=1 Tax=Roseofilum acuticapitatum BLCC-M154 TaxID=3022444 RepID=A0ABT7AYN7_9CYAN|nr:photosystem II complex extrinsic protein PsbU [Roseofilum acuticapitatum]MDJ1172018.1 photosystem II complex extrinsic protein PsbU [Roseofilum acuticapitatum BLCC-M154]